MENINKATPATVCRLPQVMALTGLPRSTLYARIKDGKFPKQVALGSPRTVGWLKHEIEGWVSEQVAASRGETAQ